MVKQRVHTVRRRLTGVLSAVILSVVGATVGASPAVAATEQCGNVTSVIGDIGGVIARVCIYWQNEPSGPAYTTTQVRIWNPAGQGVSRLWAIVRYNDGLSPDYTNGGVADGHTYIKTERHVGTATTAFEIASNEAYYTYCAYVIPNGIEVYLGPCR